jgi:hypothetical protein
MASVTRSTVPENTLCKHARDEVAITKSTAVIDQNRLTVNRHRSHQDKASIVRLTEPEYPERIRDEVAITKSTAVIDRNRLTVDRHQLQRWH